MASDKANADFFVFGCICMIILCILFFTIVIDTKIPVGDIRHAEIICAQNEGIKYLEWNLVAYNKVTCGNDGLFEIKRSQQ